MQLTPNNSFKPTPCRGVGRVLCATLARVRRPATGRLNSGVRPHMAIIEITRWEIGFNKVACTRLISTASGLDLAESKKVTDGVLDGKIQQVSVPSLDIANRLVHTLTGVGAIASVIKEADDN